MFAEESISMNLLSREFNDLALWTCKNKNNFSFNQNLYNINVLYIPTYIEKKTIPSKWRDYQPHPVYAIDTMICAGRGPVPIDKGDVDPPQNVFV